MRRRKWLVFSVNLFLMAATAAMAQPPKVLEEISGKVVAVIDGDSLTLQRPDETKITVRLEGIDAPEGKQAYGEKSKEALAALVLSKDVTVRKTGQDKGGRTLGIVLAGGEDINLQLVESGSAWHFKKYSKDKLLAEAEERARAGKKGLWAGEDVIAPWEYRARNKINEPGSTPAPKPQ